MKPRNSHAEDKEKINKILINAKQNDIFSKHGQSVKVNKLRTAHYCLTEDEQKSSSVNYVKEGEKCE